MFGAYGSFPRPLGGGASELQVLHEDLLHAYGSAFDKSRGSYLWDLCWSDARALYAAWQANRRMLAQWNPGTASWSIPVWERNLALSPYGLSIGGRRRQLVAHESRYGVDTTPQDIEQVLRDTLGDIYVETRIHTPDNAMVHAPDNTYPWGTVDPSAPWYSTVSHMAIVVQDVAGIGPGEWYERIGRMTAALNERLNVWATFDWIKLPTGFYLDTSSMGIVPFD